MGRSKGSLNKKTENVHLEFEVENKEFDEKTEVLMASVSDESVEEIQKELDLARVELEKTKLEIETKKHELKSMSVVSKSVDSPSILNKNATSSEKLAEKKTYENEMVTGKFYNLRVKGQSAKLTYMHHADDPVKWYIFEHGQIYTIFRGFADEINNHYHTPHFIKNEGVILDPSNPESGIHEVDTSDKMYSFVPLNF